jgi:hypothetical protein
MSGPSLAGGPRSVKDSPIQARLDHADFYDNGLAMANQAAVDRLEFRRDVREKTVEVASSNRAG